MRAFLRQLLAPQPQEIDTLILSEMGRGSMESFRVHTRDLPAYRYVDLFRAIEAYTGEHYRVRAVSSEHNEPLNALLHGKRPRFVNRRIQRSGTVPWPAGPDEEAYLPVDQFWLCRAREGDSRGELVLRLRYNAYGETAILEAAAESPDLGEACLKEILDLSLAGSIYRNHVLELAFESGTKDEYGDVEKPERFRILFKAHEPLGDRDVVIDEDVRQILRRNVIDLHLRRDILKANRVPVRRGVLLYGPPGTGKTFACRYLCSKLTETTRIIVTGTALLKVSAVFSFARMLQPALVILEDVDLVFAAREINLYSSVLGDLLDQMDGLRPFEDIGIVLTTNSIDRMEAAIKDRPGRISQCIFFGPPDAELRKRYLEHYLRHHATGALEFGRLVMRSEGATQAFLKE
ncbi:MAG: ATP-binding protein [Kiloniellales bacterium]|nr:ATP-binding protein [Kiloniellales bacterium]